MARPVKCRRVEQLPPYARYKPAGVSCKNNKIMVLMIDELEAMRLKDVEGLSQIECAEHMQVSRQTFQLILEKARKTIVLANSRVRHSNRRGKLCDARGFARMRTAMRESPNPGRKGGAMSIRTTRKDK